MHELQVLWGSVADSALNSPDDLCLPHFIAKQFVGILYEAVNYSKHVFAGHLQYGGPRPKHYRDQCCECQHHQRHKEARFRAKRRCRAPNTATDRSTIFNIHKPSKTLHMSSCLVCRHVLNALQLHLLSRPGPHSARPLRLCVADKSDYYILSSHRGRSSGLHRRHSGSERETPSVYFDVCAFYCS
jgi:hypothetical protein